MSTHRFHVRNRVREIIAEFFLQHYPTERYSGADVCEEDLTSLDVPFFDFWQEAEEAHVAMCTLREMHRACLECDALRELHPGPITGVSEPFHARLLEAGQFEALGRMTLPLAVIRPSQAV